MKDILKMRDKNLKEKIEEASKMHEKARKKWFGERDESEEAYKTDVEILVQCVREGQDIEPIHTKAILMHQAEIHRYNALMKSAHASNFNIAFESYMGVFKNFDNLHEQKEIERRQVEQLMRAASYV